MRPKAPRHGRVKPKYKPTPDTEQKKYWAWLREFGCVVCGADASIHHVTTKDGYSRLTRNHLLVTPLCPLHHQHEEGIHTLGHEKFTAMHDINLWEEAHELWKQYNEKK